MCHVIFTATPDFRKPLYIEWQCRYPQWQLRHVKRNPLICLELFVSREVSESTPTPAKIGQLHTPDNAQRRDELWRPRGTRWRPPPRQLPLRFLPPLPKEGHEERLRLLKPPLEYPPLG